MSATSSVSYGRGVEERGGLLARLVRTEDSLALTIARLFLGLVMFPHAAQKVFGWFGGYGWSGTMGFFTSLGMPASLAAAAIVVELVASIALIAGAFSRLAALGIAAIMIGAIVTVHAKFGFFMNWGGNQQGEGFEYHLLAIALALVTMIAGGGRASVDWALARRLGQKSKW